MKLAYAFLAEKAEQSSNGRLWIAGADLDVYKVANLTVQPQFDLVAKYLFDAKEIGRHEINLELTRPTGERAKVLETPRVIEVTTPEQRLPQIKLVVHLTIQVHSWGSHRFHLMLDGSESASLPLYLYESQASEKDVADDESTSWDDLDATAMSPRQLQDIADFVRSTGQASA